MIRKTFFGLAAVLFSAQAFTAPIDWTEWKNVTTGVQGQGSALGTMGSISVSYSGDVTTPQDPNKNYWTEVSSAPYTGNTVVDNAPTDPNMIALEESGDKKIKFDSTVKDPIFAIVSLGRSNQRVTYDFKESFEVLSEGEGFWGEDTSPPSIGQNKNALDGDEFHGVLQFQGHMDSLEWNVSKDEYWHGFAVGSIAAVPEPGSLALFALGLTGLFGRRAFRRV